jgi:formamidopyrimidine-DNA glycosylase
MSEDHELYKQKIAFYQESGRCPVCYTEVEIEGYHERDSTWDKHYCPKCDWYCHEIDLWNMIYGQNWT